MAQSKPFTSKNATLRIFDNSTAAQQTLLNTLMTALQNAGSQTPLTDAQKQGYFATYIAGMVALQGISYFDTALTLTGSTLNVTPAAQVEGFYSGSFSKLIGGVTYAGTWVSTGTQSTTAMTARINITSVTGIQGSATSIPSFVIADFPNFATIVAGTSAVALSGTATIPLQTVVHSLIDGITAYGDTGEKDNVVTAKLINRSGTFKGKGSTDGGDWSFDMLEIPADAGQQLVVAAKADQTANANRVWVQTFNNSNDGSSIQRWYGIGLVPSITAPAAVDAYVSLKVTVPLQDGQVRSSVFIAGI
ncbi:MAG: hypothetical protein PHD53_00135 [Methylococcales bacterium]|nr:hypothetical protein [Methylococcales bacterium]